MKKLLLASMAMIFTADVAMANVLSITRQENPNTGQYRINFYTDYGADGVRGGSDDTVVRYTAPNLGVANAQPFSQVLHDAINAHFGGSLDYRFVDTPASGSTPARTAAENAWLHYSTQNSEITPPALEGATPDLTPDADLTALDEDAFNGGEAGTRYTHNGNANFITGAYYFVHVPTAGSGRYFGVRTRFNGEFAKLRNSETHTLSQWNSHITNYRDYPVFVIDAPLSATNGQGGSSANLRAHINAHAHESRRINWGVQTVPGSKIGEARYDFEARRPATPTTDGLTFDRYEISKNGHHSLVEWGITTGDNAINLDTVIAADHLEKLDGALEEAYHDGYVDGYQQGFEHGYATGYESGFDLGRETN